MMESGLIAHYQFENGLSDSGPSGYTLLVSGLSQPLYSDSEPAFGNYSLKSTNSFGDGGVWLGAPGGLKTLLASGTTPSFTFEFMFYPRFGVGNGVKDFISFRDFASNVNDYRLNYQVGSITQLSIASPSATSNINTTNHLTYGKFLNLAITYNDTTREIKTYVNNNQIGTNVNVLGLSGIRTMLLLGRTLVDYNDNATGEIDSFKIYNYVKSGFLNLNSGLYIGVPDQTYIPRLYDNSFGQVINGYNPVYSSLSGNYFISLTGIYRKDSISKILISKNNWVAARVDVSGALPSDRYNLI